MKTLFFRALMIGASLFLLSQIGALVAILVLDGPPNGIDWRVSLWLGLPVVESLMAFVLVGLLLFRRSVPHYFPPLMILVVLLPIAANGIVLSSIWFRPTMPSWLWMIARPRWPVVVAAPWLVSGAFLRFSALFLQASRTENSTERLASARGVGLVGERLRRLQKLSFHPGLVWSTVVALIGISIGVPWLLYGPFELRLREPFLTIITATIFVVVVMVMLVAASVGVRNLRTAYRDLDTSRRLQLRWLVFGMAGAFWLASLVLATWLVLPPEFVLIHEFILQILPSVVVFVFLVAVYMAVFYDGAVDPSLAIRRTTVYGALGVLFIVLFAVVESLVSEVLEARLGLPTMLGAAISGASVALIVIPLRGRFSRWMDRWVPEPEK